MGGLRRPTVRQCLIVGVLGLDVVRDLFAPSCFDGDMGLKPTCGVLDGKHVAGQEFVTFLGSIGQHDLGRTQSRRNLRLDGNGLVAHGLGHDGMGDFVGDAFAEHGLRGRLLPGRERKRLVSKRRGGGQGLRFGKGCLHLGIDKRLGDLDLGIDGEGLTELGQALLAVLEPADVDHAQMNVGARRRRMAVEMRAPTQFQRLGEQGCRAFHVQRLVQRQGFLVQLDDFVQRPSRPARRRAQSPPRRARGRQPPRHARDERA